MTKFIYLYAVTIVYIWGLEANACTIYDGSRTPVGSIDSYGSVYKGREVVGEVDHHGSIFRNRDTIGNVLNGSVFKDREYIGKVENSGGIFKNRELIGYGESCNENQLGAALLLLLLEK